MPQLQHGVARVGREPAPVTVMGGGVNPVWINPNSNGSKPIQTFPKFDRSENYIPMLKKIEIKYDFEDLEEMNNVLHRNFLTFEMDLELKFREFSRLEFDRI
jgi:hypothetical protein